MANCTRAAMVCRRRDADILEFPFQLLALGADLALLLRGDLAGARSDDLAAVCRSALTTSFIYASTTALTIAAASFGSGSVALTYMMPAFLVGKLDVDLVGQPGDGIVPGILSERYRPGSSISDRGGPP